MVIVGVAAAGSAMINVVPLLEYFFGC